MSIIDIDHASRLLIQGEVIGLPTETVYGLAGRIDQEETLKRIFSVKQRPFFDPLIVHVADIQQARSLAADWPDIFEDLAKALWPGPLTLVARKTPQVSSLITSGLDTVGLRCPNHPVALEVLKKVGVPLAAPSANRFGRTSPTCAEDVEQEFAGSVAVLDGGRCTVGVESTVVQAEDMGTHWRLHILRPGGVTRERIRQTLEPKHKIEIVRSASVASPGHLQTHYQPQKPLYIVEGDREVTNAELSKQLHRQISQVNWLVLPPAPEQAARTLYAEFRRLSETGDVILVRRQKEHATENWEAVWDRIDRASSGHFA